MNEYMQKACEKRSDEIKETSPVSFRDGFKTAHDILLPLLREALKEIRPAPSGDNYALIQRIKQVVED